MVFSLPERALIMKLLRKPGKSCCSSSCIPISEGVSPETNVSSSCERHDISIQRNWIVMRSTWEKAKVYQCNSCFRSRGYCRVVTD
ncbi:hypothetical protein NPIL_499811 [Nephila pilipes]|uniref:Uncharacterized protein n=1 Tax=Nephila pilipes TaxID=299642 RepID=A0A8X6P148_NEPPI|nr:hypothetical protein NPIL_499811 [Nephila pilipes]